jgi:hypothetical protein
MNDISFIITTYKDFDRLELLSEGLRTHNYPLHNVSVLSDGDSDERIQSLCLKYGFKYYYYENSYGIDSGFRFWRNVFEVYRKNPTAYMIKLDTDVKVNGPLITPLDPDFRATMFGCFVGARHPNATFIQNGIRGFHSSIIDAIESSDLSRDDAYFTEKFKLTKRFNSTNRIERGLISTEFLMCEITSALQIPIKEHPEIVSYWRCPKTKGYYGKSGALFSEETFQALASKASLAHPFYPNP